MPLVPVEEVDETNDTSKTEGTAEDAVQLEELESQQSTSSENQSSSTEEAASEEREAGDVLPTEIMALLTVLIGDSISDIEPEKLQEIVVSFGESVVQILAVAAVIMKVPLAEENPIYQDIISQFSGD